MCIRDRSYDGSIISIGASWWRPSEGSNNWGAFETYQYNAQGGSGGGGGWDLIGHQQSSQYLNGTTAANDGNLVQGESLGSAIGLSHDGRTIAVLSNGYGTNSTLQGRAFIFENSG